MAQIAVIDQYGAGIAVLTAGPVDALNILYRAVLGTFFPAIEEETRRQALRFTGTWTSNLSNNSTSISTNKPRMGTKSHSPKSSPNTQQIKLTLDLDDGPGLKLTSFTRGNQSMITAIKSIWEAEFLPLGFGVLSDDFRIYPTDLEHAVPASEARNLLPCGNVDCGNQIIRQEWRINLDVIPLGSSAMSDLPGQTIATQYCGSWQMVDWMTYGGIGLDKIVFVVEKGSGDVLGVEVPALRGGLLTR